MNLTDLRCFYDHLVRSGGFYMLGFNNTFQFQIFNLYNRFDYTSMYISFKFIKQISLQQFSLYWLLITIIAFSASKTARQASNTTQRNLSQHHCSLWLNCILHYFSFILIRIESRVDELESILWKAALRSSLLEFLISRSTTRAEYLIRWELLLLRHVLINYHTIIPFIQENINK